MLRGQLPQKHQSVLCFSPKAFMLKVKVSLFSSQEKPDYSEGGRDSKGLRSTDVADRFESCLSRSIQPCSALLFIPADVFFIVSFVPFFVKLLLLLLLLLL